MNSAGTSVRRRRRRTSSRAAAPQWSGPGHQGWKWLGLLAGGLWGGWLAFLLLGSASPFVTAPLAFRSTDNIALLAGGRNESHALAFVRAPAPGGGVRHTLRLDLPVFEGDVEVAGENRWIRDPDLRLGELRSLGLYLEREAGSATPWQEDDLLGLVAAHWVAPDGRVWTVPRPEAARRGHLVEFFPAPPGAATSGPTNRPPGLLDLTTREGQGLYLRGWVRTVPRENPERVVPPLGRLVVRLPALPAQPQGSTNLFYPEGRCTYPLKGAAPTRAEVMAHIWGFRSGSVVVVIAVGLGVAWGLGLGIFSGALLRGTDGAGLAAFGLVACLAGLVVPIVLLVPPFHGPDEIRHAISYARLRNDPDLMARMVDLGQALHHESVHYRADEKLGLERLRVPEPYAFDRNTLRNGGDVTAFQDYWTRAPVVAHLWHWVGARVNPASAALTVLWVRLLGAGAAILLAGLGAAVWWAAARHDGERWAALWPLAFFPLTGALGMLSNYAVLTGASLLLGFCIGAVWMRPAASRRVAFALGVALGLAVHTSVNALPLAAAVGMWLAHLAFEPRRHVLGTRWAALWWLALGGGFCLTRLLGSREYHEGIVDAAGLPAGWGLVSEPAFLFTVACAVGACVEWLARGDDRQSAMGSTPPGEISELGQDTWNPRVRFLAGILMAMVLAASLLPKPALEDREAPWRYFPNQPLYGHPLRTVEELDMPVETFERRRHVTETAEVLVRNLNIAPRDYIMVRSLWSGLLVADVRVPGWVAGAGLAVLLGGMCLLLAVALGGGAHDRMRTVLWFAAVLAGIVFVAAAYWPRNPHGRYLMSLALAGLAVAALGWAAALRPILERRPVSVLAATLVFLTLLQGTVAWCLALRFY